MKGIIAFLLIVAGVICAAVPYADKIFDSVSDQLNDSGDDENNYTE